MLSESHVPPDPETPRPAPVPAAPGEADGAVATEVIEVGGRGGPEPTRYGDGEKNGRCIDF